ncbi:hypothetical protein [Micromonospora sp. WMMD1082]|uniref:hypothetical protein n=1 Tax=Micromonospora sp. WMMD1082 TaxID=3016104 RepID=UPI0024178ADA|nr:hypothetical protein [Micromonospora sp. WMMD1082]MDG4792730.1 hypothetical protein [Micromonospora sp. WMMD1082]
MSAFAQLWDTPAEPIALDAVEAELIAAAAAGNSAAQLRLFVAYVPVLRRVLAPYVRVLPLDDARQAAWLGLVAACRAFDPARSTRLASILREHTAEALSEAAQEAGAGFTVPSRTVARFFGILAAADGDPAQAAALAPAHSMTPETFWAVHAAVTASTSLDDAIEAHGDGGLSPIIAPREIADTEDRILCDLALRSVDDFARDVVALAYGFSDFDPQPDAEIGHRLGGYSRLKIQRTRTRALATMRRALGALTG